jgi:hypothetical protein
MTISVRRIVLGITVLISAYVGIWAQFFPDAFYTSFPGFGLHWIDVDGPSNEHLIRDVGSFYLALGAASVAALFSREVAVSRVVGLAWAVFGVLHFAYHALHLPAAPIDLVGNVVSLGLSALCGIVLTLPAPKPERE